MRIGIFAKTFDGRSPGAVLAQVRRAGFEAAQYNMACSGLDALPAAVDAAVAGAIAEASRATSVEISAVSATYNMIHPDLAKREAGRRAFAAIAGAARHMGASLVTVCSGSRDPLDQWRHHPDNSGVDAWRAMTQEFERLLPIAERCDIAIGIEPELANVVSSAKRARDLIDSMGSPRLRIVFDAANLFEIESPERRKVIITQAVDLLGGDIALAHAKDRRPDGGFARAGAGVIDFPHYIAALRRAGFDGALIAHGLDAADAPEVAQFLRGALAAAS